MSQCQKFGLVIRAFKTEGLEQATVGEEQGWWASLASSDHWSCLFSVLSTVTGYGVIMCIHLLGWFSHLLEALGKPAVFWCLLSLRPLRTCGLAFLQERIPASCWTFLGLPQVLKTSCQHLSRQASPGSATILSAYLSLFSLSCYLGCTLKVSKDASWNRHLSLGDLVTNISSFSYNNL